MEVGKEYRLKVTLTNVSYTVNTFKLVALGPAVSDVVSIERTPAGPLSAGLSTDIMVVFRPWRNEVSCFSSGLFDKSMSDW